MKIACTWYDTSELSNQNTLKVSYILNQITSLSSNRENQLCIRCLMYIYSLVLNKSRLFRSKKSCIEIASPCRIRNINLVNFYRRGAVSPPYVCFLTKKTFFSPQNLLSWSLIRNREGKFFFCTILALFEKDKHLARIPARVADPDSVDLVGSGLSLDAKIQNHIKINNFC